MSPQRLLALAAISVGFLCALFGLMGSIAALSTWFGNGFRETWLFAKMLLLIGATPLALGVLLLSAGVRLCRPADQGNDEAPTRTGRFVLRAAPMLIPARLVLFAVVTLLFGLAILSQGIDQAFHDRKARESLILWGFFVVGLLIEARLTVLRRRWQHIQPSAEMVAYARELLDESPELSEVDLRVKLLAQFGGGAGFLRNVANASLTPQMRPGSHGMYFYGADYGTALIFWLLATVRDALFPHRQVIVGEQINVLVRLIAAARSEVQNGVAPATSNLFSRSE